MENHELRHEFPQYAEKMNKLIESDVHFKEIFEKYHQVNNEIVKIESGEEIAIDEYLNELRMKRVRLKDEIYSSLSH